MKVRRGPKGTGCSDHQPGLGPSSQAHGPYLIPRLLSHSVSSVGPVPAHHGAFAHPVLASKALFLLSGIVHHLLTCLVLTHLSSSSITSSEKPFLTLSVRSNARYKHLQCHVALATVTSTYVCGIIWLTSISFTRMKLHEDKAIFLLHYIPGLMPLLSTQQA